jgi:hypothetical protein
MKGESFQIPKVIKILENKMKDSDFVNKKNDPFFLNKMAVVCDNCYLSIVQPLYLSCKILSFRETAGSKYHHIKQFNLVGTGRLNPEKNAFRRHVCLQIYHNSF